MTLPNRKAEAEVKSMQSALDALQRSKKEVESATTRKEKEIQALTDKLNCEQTNLSKSNKQVKECGVRMHLQSKQNIQSGPSKASYCHLEGQLQEWTEHSTLIFENLKPFEI